MANLTSLLLTIFLCTLASFTKSERCYIAINKTGQHWELVWQDSLKSNNLSGLAIKSETTSCNEIGPDYISCATPTNVQLIKGQAVLLAQHGQHYNHYFTGAHLYRTDYLSHGRFEIRLAQPIGQHIRTMVYLTNQDSSTGQYRGTTLIAANGEWNVLYRNIYFLHNNHSYLVRADNVFQDLNQFHVYGFEWNQEFARFFFDDIYSESVSFVDSSSISKVMGDLHKINLALAVESGELANVTINFNATKYGWTCPAMIVDYVRVYKPVDTDNQSLTRCNLAPLTPNSVIDGICKSALNRLESSDSGIDSLFVLFILSGAIVVLCSLAGLYFFIQKTNRSHSHDDKGPLVHYVKDPNPEFNKF